MCIMIFVIFGLVIVIILCGFLYNFFYKWLIKNFINFFLGELFIFIVELENVIEFIDVIEILIIE